jgi:TPR repeat protein
LAYLYDLGLGVPQDRRRGFELYTRAADLGWAEAMWNLANMYGAGQVGEKDMLMACTWTVRAERFAAPDENELRKRAAGVLERLKGVLSADDLAACQDRGQSWSPSSASSVKAPN